MNWLKYCVFGFVLCKLGAHGIGGWRRYLNGHVWSGTPGQAGGLINGYYRQAIVIFGVAVGRSGGDCPTHHLGQSRLSIDWSEYVGTRRCVGTEHRPLSRRAVE